MCISLFLVFGGKICSSPVSLFTYISDITGQLMIERCSLHLNKTSRQMWLRTYSQYNWWDTEIRTNSRIFQHSTLIFISTDFGATLCLQGLAMGLSWVITCSTNAPEARCAPAVPPLPSLSPFGKREVVSMYQQNVHQKFWRFFALVSRPCPEDLSALSMVLHFVKCFYHFFLAWVFWQYWKIKPALYFFKRQLELTRLQYRISFHYCSLNITFRVILRPKKEKYITTQHKCCNFLETSSCKISLYPLYFCIILLSCRSVQVYKEVIILDPSHPRGNNFFPLFPLYTCHHI